MIIVQLDSEQLSDLIQNSVARAMKTHQSATVETDHPDQLLTIQQAAEFLHLATPTIYSKVSRGEIPVMKRSKRLYFSREQLTEYIKAGRKLTNAEIEQQADQYLTSKNGRRA